MGMGGWLLVEVTRRRWIFWSWSYRQLYASWQGHWEPTHPLEEQLALSNAELSLQPLDLVLRKKMEHGKRKKEIRKQVKEIRIHLFLIRSLTHKGFLGRAMWSWGRGGSSVEQFLPLRTSRNSSTCRRRSYSPGLEAEPTVLEENINTKGWFGFNQHFQGGASKLSLDWNIYSMPALLWVKRSDKCYTPVPAQNGNHLDVGSMLENGQKRSLEFSWKGQILVILYCVLF